MPVGRGDDADIDVRLRSVGADALDLAGFEEPQQQPLHALARLPDFVHEEGAAMRQFECAGSIAVCAREAAAHVAEEFRFEQGFGERGAVHGDEPRALPRTAGVNQASDHFLADTALARDEDLGVATCSVGDFLGEHPQRLGVADHGPRVYHAVFFQAETTRGSGARCGPQSAAMAADRNGWNATWHSCFERKLRKRL